MSSLGRRRINAVTGVLAAVLLFSMRAAFAAGGPDADKDGIPDIDDWCPNAAEVINNIDDDDGCPDTREGLVRIEDGNIKILERIGFLSGNTTILKRSTPLLDQLAAVIKNNSQIALLRIEGHTDNQGDEAKNLKLSEQRAMAVKQALVVRGVESSRLESAGFGPKRPVSPNDTDDGRAKNRRVDFVVAKIVPVSATGAGDIALLLAAKGTVGVDQPNGLRGKGTQGMTLPNASTLSTGVDGSAEINMPSTSRLQIHPSTQTRIWTRNDGTGPASRVQVAAGSIWAKVAGPADGRDKEKFEVKTPNASIKARGTEFNINVVKTGDTYGTQVSTLEGAVEVAAGGQTVTVPAGQGVTATGPATPVGRGAKPTVATVISVPRALPGVLSGLKPFWGEFEGKVPMTWQAKPGVTYRVQVARDIGFTEIVADANVTEPRYDFVPDEAGAYYWRVSAVDAGLEGPNSQRFKVTVVK